MAELQHVCMMLFSKEKPMTSYGGEQQPSSSASTPGLKVTGLSEPRLAQSFSQSSSADAGPSSAENSPMPRHEPSSRAEEINAQAVVIYCLLCSGGAGKKEGNQLQIELSLFEPG